MSAEAVEERRGLFDGINVLQVEVKTLKRSSVSAGHILVLFFIMVFLYN